MAESGEKAPFSSHRVCLSSCRLQTPNITAMLKRTADGYSLPWLLPSRLLPWLSSFMHLSQNVTRLLPSSAVLHPSGSRHSSTPLTSMNVRPAQSRSFSRFLGSSRLSFCRLGTGLWLWCEGASFGPDHTVPPTPRPLTGMYSYLITYLRRSQGRRSLGRRIHGRRSLGRRSPGRP